LDIAISTHSQNHPYAKHICETLDSVDPRKVVPGGRLDILWASPECTHHSRARGGKPCSDQSRASAWHVVRWAEALYIKNIIVENVQEFLSWGPLGSNGKPLKSRKGETFRAFLIALESLGYKVDYRVLNAAYYGDPTTRERLFVIARRGRQPITWPEPTHTPDGEAGLFGKTKRWRTAREIIDWGIPGQSIYERKKPLSQNTMNRIYAGLRKFCSKEFEPFLVQFYGTNNARSIDRPAPTVTTSGNHTGLCQPFIVEYYGKGKARSVNKPLSTQTTRDRMGLCQPFLLRFNKGYDGVSIDKPAPTLTTKDKLGLCEPFLVGITQTGGNGSRVRSVNSPVPTICTKEEFALCEPFVLGQQSCAAPRSVNQPVPTVAGSGAISLIQPKINGQTLDIRFRMLRPHELARAMSFGDDYKFAGNRAEQVKQIGNAVPVMLAKELCKSLLD
jgi:DNA (cytosine-5)-methyltransferase 1